MIDFIEQRCWEFVHAYQTEEESDMLWFTTIMGDCWNKFMVWYYEIIEEFATIRVCNSFQISVNILSAIFLYIVIFLVNN